MNKNVKIAVFSVILIISFLFKNKRTGWIDLNVNKNSSNYIESPSENQYTQDNYPNEIVYEYKGNEYTAEEIREYFGLYSETEIKNYGFKLKQKRGVTNSSNDLNSDTEYKERTKAKQKEGISSNSGTDRYKKSLPYMEIPENVFTIPENGFSPYDSYFGKGIYNNSTQNTIKINTPKNAHIVFLLKDVYSKRIIRNEFIRKNSTFSLTSIPYGTYEFTYFSGTHWSDEALINNGKVKGAFLKGRSYSKSDDVKDWMEFKKGYYGAYELTLTQVANGNLETEATNEEEFFN